MPAVEAYRDDVKPIEITQPEGPSFTVDGHAVAWQKWQLRIGFTPREGLVLHQVGYDGRPIVYRASLAEMYVPYGDPAPTHRFKNVFDQGEYGVGWLANQLTLGCDCVGHIQYFDAVVNDNDGAPVTINNAVCMHEEDAGIAWKHTDFRTGAVQVRRRRRLVISTIVTVGNYEYGYFWYLYNDGLIEYEIKLSGVISTGAIAPGETPKHGTLVAPGLYGPNHQHFFCVRLDMSVDGRANTVVEVDSAPSRPGPDNPHGNAWEVHRTVLASEAVRETRHRCGAGAALADRERREDLCPRRAHGLRIDAWLERAARCTRPTRSTPRGPGSRSTNCGSPPTTTRSASPRATTPPSTRAARACPMYGAGDRPLEGTDVVVWYTFGAHHVVRPEDWPVMPVSTVGFMLKPTGFFDGNPALDLPPTTAHCHS